MRVLVQRVSRAEVRVRGESGGTRTTGRIDTGFVLLVGFTHDDDDARLSWMADKVIGLRVFGDGEGKMNRALEEVGGALLVVSQFTLYGDARRGRRPSWSDAAPPEAAEPLYELFVAEARRLVPRVETGSFRRMMEVELVNDGPVTILLDSRKLF